MRVQSVDHISKDSSRIITREPAIIRSRTTGNDCLCNFTATWSRSGKLSRYIYVYIWTCVICLAPEATVGNIRAVFSKRRVPVLIFLASRIFIHSITCSFIYRPIIINYYYSNNKFN